MSNFCIYVFILLFSFYIYGDRRSVKIENEVNNTKSLITEALYIGLDALEIRIINTELYPGWLELPLTGTNFHGLSLFEPLKFSPQKSSEIICPSVPAMPNVRTNGADTPAKKENVILICKLFLGLTTL